MQTLSHTQSTSRQPLLVPTLFFLGLVSTAVGSLGAPLLPTIVNVDHVSLADSQWALTISLLVGAVATPVMGRFGDGRRRRVVIIAGIFLVLLGCVCSALPAGFSLLLVGRGLQGVGLGLVPLAIATARDALPKEASGSAIALLGVTTAAGIGVGYPVAGVITQYLGLSAAFWFGTIVCGLALVSAVLVLPAGPERSTRKVDIPGAILLGAAVTGLLLVLSEGLGWGWTSIRLLAVTIGSLALLIGWVMLELRTPYPLVDLRQLRHQSVLAANATMLLVGLGIYPLLSFAVRFVQTPPKAGYGFGASVVVAGLMLVPFSLASFVASKVALPVARRTSPEFVVVLSCVVLLIAMGSFLIARDTLWEILLTMGIAGFGVGCIFASNPLQIVRGVTAQETGSAMSFYQVLRSIGFSAGSALSATVLTAFTPAGQVLPTAEGYSVAALVNIGILLVALALSIALARVGEN
ncbi:MFS transporter [Dictyobacter alpinus]|uniref:MFS transporter n=1 Tax=Dictyobacter alpinus TaxID=2014873 RepID=A0A402BEN3_9CHLR|nr:MFS transporter [Dictyobacter alpinus]GCE29760.1 MFS transporter [Dictyobacter alpinus]